MGHTQANVWTKRAKVNQKGEDLGRRTMKPTVVGIDVGGKQKGFHAVSFNDGKFLSKTTNLNPDEIDKIQTRVIKEYEKLREKRG